MADALKVRRPWWRRPAVRVAEQRLTRQRIYILPTRNGLLFGVVLGAMLVGAMNYDNSLAYGLTFLLAGMGVVAIVHTYRNLAGITVRAGECRPVFAGERAAFPIAVDNRGAARLALAFELGVSRVVADVARQSVHWIELELATTRRGWCELPTVTVATTFPLGLFRAWSYLDLRQRCLVYPRPEPKASPFPAGRGAGEEVHLGKGYEDFAALRDYRAGDSLRHVHWKALAREQGVLTKEFEGNGGEELWFDWDRLAGLPTEARLARLCRWVIDADAQGHRYALTLPGRRLGLDGGPQQRQRCLEALALFGEATP